MFLAFCPFLLKDDNQLFGKWQLVKIETSKSVLIPEKGNFNLEISAENISYNKDINTCWAENFSIANSNIFIYLEACTEKCCDGKIDSISNYINYNGNYIVNDTLLKITNENGNFYFTRSDK